MTELPRLNGSSAPIDRWENDGGGLAVASKPSPAVRRRQGKRAEDTASGCRANAAADLARARTLSGERMRWRMEHSAAAWTARADLLERLDRKFEARLVKEG